MRVGGFAAMQKRASAALYCFSKFCAATDFEPGVLPEMAGVAQDSGHLPYFCAFPKAQDDRQ